MTVLASAAMADQHVTSPAPEAEAVAGELLAAVRAGDVAKVVALHTDAARARPIADHLALDSGAEPNLAFLAGRGFEIVSLASSGWPRDLGMGGIPWAIACPSCLRVPTAASVTAVLRVPAGAEPFLVPPALAFGARMAFAPFMDYVKQPDVPDHLTLRVRPTLARGLIADPPGPPPGHPSLAIQRPRDTGAVVLPSGAALDPTQLAALVPRVPEVVVTIELARGTRFSSWRVERFRVDRVAVRGVAGTLTVAPR
ncbi:MAG: hypothetical protein HYR51_08015 [Candidatus Rokubacteria bacterium]|nr:hypothetical protein [Candidatus Rokubacteria bacterium]